MSRSPPDISIAVLGAGIGGLTAAALLDRAGFRVRLYEQATGFARVGAGIQMSNNAMRVLRGLGLEDRIRATAFRPASWRNRSWDTGEMLHELPLGDESEAKYGAPYLLMHRGDLHEALASCVRPEIVVRGARLTDIDQGSADGVTLRFENGTTGHADALIACDGVHSRVREILIGREAPSYTGMVAYRTTFPAHLLRGAGVVGNGELGKTQRRQQRATRRVARAQAQCLACARHAFFRIAVQGFVQPQPA